MEDAGRRPRTEVWFPLLVFGLINIPGAALAWIIGREHLGIYFFPMNILGGLACAWYYKHAGRTTGLQAPTLIWLAVILGATVAAAACSSVGRDQGWDGVNLAGPTISLIAGFTVLGIWARSSTLLLVTCGTGAAVVLVLVFARGNTAIGLQLLGFSVTMLPLAALNYYQRWKPA